MVPSEFHTRIGLLQKIIKCRRAMESVTETSPLRDLVELYDWLSRPVEELLPSSSGGKIVPHLIIIPDGPLYYLPFQALNCISEGRSEHAYLIERYAITYAFRLTEIGFGEPSQEQTPSVPIFIGLANPNPDPNNPSLRLPEAVQEAYRVSACFPIAKIYTDEQASEEVIGDNLYVKLLLFAAHGNFEPANAMYSCIALIPTVETGGKLYAYEVYSRFLEVDTITLSACETQRSKTSRSKCGK